LNFGVSVLLLANFPLKCNVSVDHRKLPFMAMLRNLRNVIKAGISEKHHSWVLNKLSDEVRISSCCCCYYCSVVVEM